MRQTFGLTVLAAMMLAGLSGCNSAFMHELQPHRLWRLNRGPAPGNGAMYSVEDPLPDSQFEIPTASTELMTAAVIAPGAATE
ncbi:hypothetical protein OAH18_00320 [bacterium]|nr:hypothetical protein [bacterium]